MITNTKIERKKTDIARTETKLTEVRAKLREQKLELINLENEEIVAMFRREVITESDFSALLRSRREAESEFEDDSRGGQKNTASETGKEETPDAFS
jgi:hypothetical protein